MKAITAFKQGGDSLSPSAPSQALPLPGPKPPCVQREHPGSAVPVRKAACLTWPTAEGGDDGQDAHDTQVRDPGGVVLQESRGVGRGGGSGADRPGFSPQHLPDPSA